MSRPLSIGRLVRPQSRHPSAPPVPHVLVCSSENISDVPVHLLLFPECFPSNRSFCPALGPPPWALRCFIFPAVVRDGRCPGDRSSPCRSNALLRLRGAGDLTVGRVRTWGPAKRVLFPSCGEYGGEPGAWSRAQPRPRPFPGGLASVAHVGMTVTATQAPRGLALAAVWVCVSAPAPGPSLHPQMLPTPSCPPDAVPVCFPESPTCYRPQPSLDGCDGPAALLRPLCWELEPQPPVPPAVSTAPRASSTPDPLFAHDPTSCTNLSLW